MKCEWDPELGRSAQHFPDKKRLGCANDATLLVGTGWLLCESCADMDRFIGYVSRRLLSEMSPCPICDEYGCLESHESGEHYGMYSESMRPER